MPPEPADQPSPKRFALSGHKTLLLIWLGMALLLGALFYYRGAMFVWALWAVPTKAAGFADLRAVLDGIQLASSSAHNAGGTYGLVGGYPGIWMLLGFLGLAPVNTVGTAWTMFCAFGLSVYFFARRHTALSAILVSAIVFSPAAMLGYERANLDLAMFVLLTIALLLVSVSTILPVVVILLAGLLKLYPILGLGYLLRLPRAKFLQWAGIGLGIFLIYLLSIGRGAQGIIYIPKGDLFAYGTGVLGVYLHRAGAPGWEVGTSIALSFLALYLLALAILFLSYKRGAHGRLDAQASLWLDAFRLGALIYIGTFVQGNSFNYRLVMLIFCVPQLVAWARQPGPVWLEARLALAGSMVSCWGVEFLWLLPEALVLTIVQAANWTLLASLLYLLIVSLPDWIFAEIESFFRKYDRSAHSISP